MALDYERARDDWLGNDEYSFGTREDADRAMDLWRSRWGSGDRTGEVLNLSNQGGYIDLFEQYNNPNGGPKRRTWTAAGNNGPNPNGAGNAPAPGATPHTTPGITPAAPARDSRWDGLYNELYARANQGLAVSRQDPVIRQQADAYSANEERARRNYLGDLAEKSAPGANLRGEERMSAERVGQRTGAMEAELMGRELAAKRDEIAMALEARRGMLTAEQQMALTEKLAQYDNAIKQQQIGLQGRGLDLQGRQLDSQNNQFLAQLGFQVDDRKSYWDAIRSGVLGS